jgi:hypothetical protein
MLNLRRESQECIHSIKLFKENIKKWTIYLMTGYSILYAMPKGKEWAYRKFRTIFWKM